MDVANTALIFCILRDINSRLALPLALTFLLLPTNLILSPVRFETYVILTVLLGYWCHKKAKPLLATVFWSVGCWMKWFPAFFIAAQEWRALIVERRRWQWLAATAVFLSVAAVLNLPFILVSFAVHGNIDAWSFPYRFHAGRGVSGDTILGVATMWIGELTVARYSGVWTLVLLTAAMFVKPSLRIEYRCVLICISLVLLNRVYSTQFNMWFYPFVLLAAAQETSPRLPRLLALLITLDVTNVLVYPLLFTWTLDEIGRFGPLAAARDGGLWTTAFSVAVILRGVLLVALAAFVLCDVGERERE
jgi:hypothetical protein